MSDDKPKTVTDFAAGAAIEREQPIEVQLPDPGPYLLPRMAQVSVYVPDPKTFELLLETERRQQVRIPIAGDQIFALKDMIDHLVGGAARNQSDGEGK